MQDMRETADFVKSLDKGLKILHVFSESRNGMTLTDVANTTEITRAAARRFLLTLKELGYLKQDGRYFHLTPKILSLSAAYLTSDTLPDVAYPFLKELTEKVHESASLSVLAGEDIVYVARVLTERIMSVNLQVGTRLPAWCTSMGRAQIAFLPEEEIAALTDRIEWTQRTPNTINTPKRFVAELEKIRELKYAIVDQELEIGVVSIAVPVFSKKGKVVAAINVAGHATRTKTADLIREVLPHLKHAAQGIENALII